MYSVSVFSNSSHSWSIKAENTERCQISTKIIFSCCQLKKGEEKFLLISTKNYAVESTDSWEVIAVNLAGSAD